MRLDLSGRLAVVSGAARGIGRAIALTMAACGADVAVLDMNREEAAVTVDQAENQGVKAGFFAVDVSDFMQVETVFREIEKCLGKTGILINSAGIVSPLPFLETDPAGFQKLIDVNLKGTYNTCRAVLSGMIERKYGKIINIASIAGKAGGGFFGNTLYGATKAGVIALTKGIAREAGPYGINVNAICPGPVETQMLADCPAEIRERILQGVPLRKFGVPQDIANTAAFLASECSSHITGESIVVDGGIMRDG